MSDMKPGDLPAFPLTQVTSMYGLTKREYIAAALSGMLACFPGTLGTFKEAAECAVMYTDALLAALEGKHE